MDTSVYIFLIIFVAVACLVGAGVLISKMRSKPSESVRPTPREPRGPYGGTGTPSGSATPEYPAPGAGPAAPGAGAPTAKPVAAEPEMEQRTLYSNVYGGGNVLCPACDGENVPSAKHCHICGQILPGKGA
ncbi:MAG: hypothetical protein IJX76_02355 [Clostridia bacterium]|nr:hypothetical protein [Clostridia bacterium]